MLVLVARPWLRQAASSASHGAVLETTVLTIPAGACCAFVSSACTMTTYVTPGTIMTQELQEMSVTSCGQLLRDGMATLPHFKITAARTQYFVRNPVKELLPALASCSKAKELQYSHYHNNSRLTHVDKRFAVVTNGI
ncbi:hypothetical protein BV898_07366 [Hypsibius exemplaris]|uniref:Uncharacterized protein n=1 Tax=Hypsibius exemplaris TaxID=2072580 RepID=A0A1W0WTL9_HYPEX|nr:hypothetical protein BV898_07366 [Hypsibius exemplaris]